MSLQSFARGIFVLLLLPFLGSCGPAPTPLTSRFTEAPTGLLFKRTTLLVADLDRSLGLYRDVLGFTVDGISESSPDSYSYPVFRLPPTARLRFATLNSPSQQRTLGLTEVRGTELPGPGQGPISSAAVIRVDDLAATVHRAAALGLTTTEPRTVANANARFTEQALVDFDGHLIVLYELRRPAE